MCGTHHAPPPRRYKGGHHQDIEVSYNRKPEWNEKLRRFELDIKNRAQLPSTKNFMISTRLDPNHDSVLMGKAADKVYTISVQYVTVVVVILSLLSLLLLLLLLVTLLLLVVVSLPLLSLLLLLLLLLLMLLLLSALIQERTNKWCGTF